MFVFLAASTLITGSASVVALLNGANPCNVYWKVGSSATLGTGSTCTGNLMALTSITATTGALISGRLLARGGAVTLDDNVINRDGCTGSTATSTATTTATSRAASSSTGASSSVGGGTSSTPGGGVSTTPIGGPGIVPDAVDVDLGQHNSSAHAEHRTVNLALRPAAAPFPDRRQRRWHRDLGRDVHRARRRHPRAGAQSRRTPRTPALTVPVPACLPFQPVARS